MSTLGCCGHQASLGRGRAEKLKQPRVLCRRHGPRAEPEATTAATTAATGRAASTRGAKGLLPKVVGKAPPPPVPARVPSPGRAAPPFLINASGDAPPAVTRQLWGLWLNPRAPALTHTGSVAERGLSAPTAGKKRSPRQECRALPCSAVSYKPRRRGARAELPRGGGGIPWSPPGAKGVPPAWFGGGSACAYGRSPRAYGPLRQAKFEGGRNTQGKTLAQHLLDIRESPSEHMQPGTPGYCPPCLELAPNTRQWGRSISGPRSLPPLCGAGPSCRRKQDPSSENCFIFPLHDRKAEKRKKKKKHLKACWKKKPFNQPKIRGVFCWEKKK